MLRVLATGHIKWTTKARLAYDRLFPIKTWVNSFHLHAKKSPSFVHWRKTCLRSAVSSKAYIKYLSLWDLTVTSAEICGETDACESKGALTKQITGRNTFWYSDFQILVINDKSSFMAQNWSWNLFLLHVTCEFITLKVISLPIAL